MEVATQIKLNKELKRRAKIEAAIKGITLKDYIHCALEAAIMNIGINAFIENDGGCDVKEK